MVSGVAAERAPVASQAGPSPGGRRSLDAPACRPAAGPLQVQRQQPRRDRVLPDRGRVRVGPAVGGPDGDLAARPGFRIGWGRFPDGAEVLYLYDKDDGCFGYAVNLASPASSEWGYAPFAA